MSSQFPELDASETAPAVFVPHGGGPWPFIRTPFGEPRELDELAGYLRSVRSLPKKKPAALLVISGHWEEQAPTVMTSKQPPMLYDYYGFPQEAYEVEWPAPGHPQLAEYVRALLEKAGFKTGADAQRGFDHGVFVPLKLTYPDADIPTVQLSLKRGLDPGEHIAIGQALAPLRKAGVFIIGIMNNGLDLLNVSSYWQQIVKGVIIVLAVLLDRKGKQ